MAFLPLLALALAEPTASPPSPERTELLAELAAKCRLPEGPPADSTILDRAWMLASVHAPERTCRGHDRKLALRLGRLIAEEPSSASGAAYGLLALFHEGGHGIKADRDLARSYRKRAWLLRFGASDALCLGRGTAGRFCCFRMSVRPVRIRAQRRSNAFAKSR
ncbi:MAG: hypothetical protein ACXW27_08490 [Allosphingosinicella sp.]